MQTSVPEVMDVSNEPDYIFDLYGEDSKNPGTFAANCLLARKLLKKTSNSSSSTTAVGINTATYPMTSKDKPKKPIRPPLRSFKTSNKEDCWKTPWSFGEENLDEPTTPKGCSNPTTTVEITTPVALPSLWLVQASKKASQLVLPTILATTLQKDPYTFTIFRQRSCTCWALTTKN